MLSSRESGDLLYVLQATTLKVEWKSSFNGANAPFPPSQWCCLTLRIMRPPIFRMVRLLPFKIQWGRSVMHLPNHRVSLRWNQQTVLSPRFKTAASNLHETSDSSLFPLKLTASIFSFFFSSFLSSTLPTWEDNSPARKMVFLLFNHAAALFPSSLNVDTLSISIHPGLSFLSLFSFFQTWTEYLSITASKLPFLKKPSPLINLPNPIEAC